MNHWDADESQRRGFINLTWSQQTQACLSSTCVCGVKNSERGCSFYTRTFRLGSLVFPLIFCPNKTRLLPRFGWSLRSLTDLQRKTCCYNMKMMLMMMIVILMDSQGHVTDPLFFLVYLFNHIISSKANTMANTWRDLALTDFISTPQTFERMNLLPFCEKESLDYQRSGCNFRFALKEKKISLSFFSYR